MEVGRRVIAVSHSEDKTIYIFGHGVYEGDKIPGVDEDTTPAGWMGKLITEEGIANPLIRLDNGKVAWGCECWWGDSDGFAERYKDYQVVEVDIDASRAKVNSNA